MKRNVMPTPLVGVYASEVIQGLGGNDSIASFYGGDDRIEGGEGNDWTGGGDGNDIVIGGPGRDALVEWAGNDRLYADELITPRAALTGGSNTFRFVESRRWRHGDSHARPDNDMTWRKLA